MKNHNKNSHIHINQNNGLTLFNYIPVLLDKKESQPTSIKTSRKLLKFKFFIINNFVSLKN